MGCMSLTPVLRIAASEEVRLRLLRLVSIGEGSTRDRGPTRHERSGRGASLGAPGGQKK